MQVLSSLLLGFVAGALVIWVVGPHLRHRRLVAVLRRLGRHDDRGDSTAAFSRSALPIHPGTPLRLAAVSEMDEDTAHRA